MNRSMKQWIVLLALGMLLMFPVIGQAANSVAEGAAERTAAQAVGEMGGHEEGTPTLIKAPKEAMITALTTVIVFVLLIVILGKSAWGPIVKGLEAREEKIRKDIQEAESARAAAEARLAEYDQRLKAAQAEVSAMIAKATQDAERVATNVKMQAQKDAEESKSKALKDIDSAREQAVGDVRAQAAELSTAIASKILKRNINADDQRQLVAQSLDQLQTLGARR